MTAILVNSDQNDVTEGPYDDITMNALHNVVIENNPTSRTLRGMIRAAKANGFKHEVRVYENILNVKIMLGE